MHIKRHALATTALTGLFFSTAAVAQTTPAPATDGVTAPVQEDAKGDIVVTGIRQSIQKSLDMKRNSSAQIDVITAEDVAKFPDTNVAEALSRLPGVTIDHTGGGEGNRVSILGIDSRLINVQLDGNNLATSSGGVTGTGSTSVQDSGRNFNFANLAPEIIGNVEVYKSTQARLDEGAVGGTIIVNSRDPLDLKPNTLSVSGNYNYNLRTKDSNPRASIFYSWHNKSGTLGFLGTVAYNRLSLGGTSISVLSGYQTLCALPSQIFGGCTNGVFNNPSLLPKVTSGPALTGTTLIPVNINSGSFVQKEQRLTLQGKIQWRPTDNLDVTLSGYVVNADDSSYNQAVISDVGNRNDDGNGYSARDPVTQARLHPITYVSVTTNAAGITGGVLSALTEREDFSYNHQELDTRAGNIKIKWSPDDTDHVEINGGHTTATGGVSPQYFFSFYGHTSGTWALSPDSSYLKTGTSLTDPTLFQTQLAGQQAGFVKTATTNDEINYGKIDYTKDVDLADWIKKIAIGFKYQEHSNIASSHFYNVNVKQTTDLSKFNYLTTSPSLVDGLGASGDLLSYAYLSQADVINYSVANRNPGSSAGSSTGDYNNTGAQYNVREKDIAGYFQADFKHGRFHGDLGLRVAFTDSSQTYFSAENSYPYTPGAIVTSVNKYHDFLPAANFVYDLTDKQLFRFNVAKVMSRPSFADESGEVDYNLQTRMGGGGNPNLGPYRATNYGVSYEYYFRPHSLFSIDAFYRDVQQYTIYRNVDTSVNVSQAALDYCNLGVGNAVTTTVNGVSTTTNVPACPGTTNPQTFLLTTPYNGSHAKVEGASVSFQSDIKWGFGVQSNVTFLTQQYGSFSETQSITASNSTGTSVGTAVNTVGKYPLPYLSKWSYTIAPYFEQGPLQIHTSYTWRDKYSVTAGRENDAPTYQAPYGQFDASVTYYLNSKLYFTASGVNLFDPIVKQFTTGNLPLSFQKYGRRISAGLTVQFK